jgi:aquaporin Z
MPPLGCCTKKLTHNAQRILAEGVGTFILCFAIILSSESGGASNAPTFQAVGYCLAALIYGFDHIASHFNPAVTLGAYLQGFLTFPLALSFILSQVVGGTLGGVLGNVMRAVPVPSFNPAPGDYGKAFAVEAMYTGALVMVMQAVGLYKGKDEPHSFTGISIGFVVAAGSATVSRISGGCFNPAVGMAIDFATLSSDPKTFEDIWLYFLAPFTGAIVATVFSRFMHGIEHDKWAVPGWFCRCRCLCCKPSAEEELEEGAYVGPEGDDGRMPLVLPISEFVGTFFIVLTSTLQSYGPNKALSVGMMVTAMVYSLDHVCGADVRARPPCFFNVFPFFCLSLGVPASTPPPPLTLTFLLLSSPLLYSTLLSYPSPFPTLSPLQFNPAVTLGVALRLGRLFKDRGKILTVFLAQFGGAFAGAVVTFILNGGVGGSGVEYPAPNGNTGASGAVFFEAGWTTFLVYTVCAVMTDTQEKGASVVQRRGHSRSYHGLAIGFVFVAGIFCSSTSGAGSGGVFNPALGLATAVIGNNNGSIKDFWIYTAGPFAGSLLGASLFAVLHLDRSIALEGGGDGEEPVPAAPSYGYLATEKSAIAAFI